MKRITVYCGSSNGTGNHFKNTAFKLGATLANNDIELIYGGAKVGLMGAVADGVLQNGGKAIGILPHFLAEKELEHKSLSEIIFVETMHQRKEKMSRMADGFVALPGGFGTMEELFEMLTWAQLALHRKPIAILNVDGYYDPLLKFTDTMIANGFLKGEYRDLLLVDTDTDSLLEQMKNYVPPLQNKWHEVK